MDAVRQLRRHAWDTLGTRLRHAWADLRLCRRRLRSVFGDRYPLDEVLLDERLACSTDTPASEHGAEREQCRREQYGTPHTSTANPAELASNAVQ